MVGGSHSTAVEQFSCRPESAYHLFPFLRSAQRSSSEPHAGGPELEGEKSDFAAILAQT